MTRPIEFLTVEEVAVIHEDQVRRYGGAGGIRDAGILESAVSAPEFAAYYGGEDVFGLAAVYMVRLIRNHPFVDGNKRTAVVAAHVFLRLNGVHLSGEARYKKKLEDLVVRVVSRDAGEEDVARLLRDWAQGARKRGGGRWPSPQPSPRGRGKQHGR